MMNRVRKLAFATVMCGVLVTLAFAVTPAFLQAEDTHIPPIHTIDNSMWPLSDEEAIEIASSYIPPAILERPIYMQGVRCGAVMLQGNLIRGGW